MPLLLSILGGGGGSQCSTGGPWGSRSSAMGFGNLSFGKGPSSERTVYASGSSIGGIINPPNIGGGYQNQNYGGYQNQNYGGGYGASTYDGGSRHSNLPWRW